MDLIGKSNGLLLDTKSALEILEQEQMNSPILTMSKSIDTLLDGGIPLSKVTEIAGIAGVGKTQIWYVINVFELCCDAFGHYKFTVFSLQLCVSVQMPELCGGLQGQAIFIDTEGSFNISRLQGDIGSHIFIVIERLKVSYSF